MNDILQKCLRNHEQSMRLYEAQESYVRAAHLLRVNPIDSFSEQSDQIRLTRLQSRPI